jgi:hypothetical protein
MGQPNFLYKKSNFKKANKKGGIKNMPERGRDYHERDAHFDGEYEGIINDGLAREGEAIGVRVDIDPFEISQRKNPFQVQPEVDPEMKRFRSLMKGKEIK